MEKMEDPKQEIQTNIEPTLEESSKSGYKWIVTTKCATHSSKDVKRYQRQSQKYQGMGLEDEVEKPKKKAKFYQFHIKEVESVVEYEDEDFGDITVINKYNGTQVRILDDFMRIAKLHAEYNEYKDELIESEFAKVEHELDV